MKAILILCLIASLNCSFLDTALCLFQNAKIRTIVSEAIEAVKAKDFNKLIQIAFANFNDVKSIVQNCLNGEPILQSKTGKPPSSIKIKDPRRKQFCIAYCNNSPYVSKWLCLQQCNKL